jgi:hypothetical protein
MGLREYLVHGEDVRRANDLPRGEFPPAIRDATWRKVQFFARFVHTAKGVGLELAEPGGRVHRARDRALTVRVTGEPVELLLYEFGRTGAAVVELSGDADAVASVSAELEHRTVVAARANTLTLEARGQSAATNARPARYVASISSTEEGAMKPTALCAVIATWVALEFVPRIGAAGNWCPCTDAPLRVPAQCVRVCQTLVGEVDQMDQVALGAPYIDIDEMRDEPRPHRYVHGGFEESHTRFSFYFPPKELYRGRFFQYLEGGAGGHENLLAVGYDGKGQAWTFDLAFDELGGYLVESNQGHFTGEGLGVRNDGTAETRLHLFDASAESALYGKQVAAEMYGEAPHHGYVFGVSGGGIRSVSCLENRPDVWAGAAPHAGGYLSTQWCAWAQAWLMARDRFPQIIDALEPGGSGRPLEGLTRAEREAVTDMFRRGYPRGAASQLAKFTPWAFTMYVVLDEDPAYFQDFWTLPGYLGADAPERLAPYVVKRTATVTKVLSADEYADMTSDLLLAMTVRLGTAGASTASTWAVATDLQVDDPEGMFMSKLTVLTGKAAGREMYLTGTTDGLLSPFIERAPDLFNNVLPGDEVEIDNSDFVAFCFYHRHAITGLMDGETVPPELAPWSLDGDPVEAQRGEPAISPNSTTSGRFEGKMLYVQPTLDAQVWVNSSWSLHRLVQRQLGDSVDEQFRLWFVENSPHGSPDFLGPALTDEKDPGVWLSRLVSYDGVTSQALRELVRWVEDGVAPRTYGDYEFTRDGELVLPHDAAERGGVQPVVSATANGGIRADVRAGEDVTLRGVAEQPPGAGSIAAAEWDFEGRGAWAYRDDTVDGSRSSITTTVTHVYDEPGTYFASFRVGARCDDAPASSLLIENLARVRIVVS